MMNVVDKALGVALLGGVAWFLLGPDDAKREANNLYGKVVEPEPILIDKADRLKILAEVAEERWNQNRLKSLGKFAHTCADPELSSADKLAILGEEFGEVARAVVEQQEGNSENRADLRKELIQTAAVAVAWIEGLDAGL